GINNHCEVLYKQDNININKQVLCDEFETQRSGFATIIIYNQQQQRSRTIWHRLKRRNLSTCHLFDDNEASQLVDEVFKFIDRLLNGTINLNEMSELKTIFCGQNIRIRNEVKKLFTNRSIRLANTQQQKHLTITTITISENPSEEEINQVCEWLQVYQYSCYISTIIDCIRMFDILKADDIGDGDDESISNLLDSSANNNCSLKEIVKVYKT
ncbi:unnamed protein product, partial [Didymodactylos carnosus]